MEENVVKEKRNFVDNIAYKNKFQFLIWVNDNVICQRYFKINGFNEESIHTEDFHNCMSGIVRSIQQDLESKSRIFMAYTNMNEPMKMTGFLTEEEVEKYGASFLMAVTNPNYTVPSVAPDGKVFRPTFINYPETTINEYLESDKPDENEFVFKFAFLIDDVPVFEKIWDGNVYPKFVRNGVDLTNSYATYDSKDTSSISFGSAIVRYMQRDKINLINDFIHRICDTLSNTFSSEYEYTKTMAVYKNNDTVDEAKREEAIAYYGVIKPVVTGHIDIKPTNKNYSYLTPMEATRASWKKATRKKTYEYFESVNISDKLVEYIEKKF